MQFKFKITLILSLVKTVTVLAVKSSLPSVSFLNFNTKRLSKVPAAVKVRLKKTTTAVLAGTIATGFKG